MIPMIALYFRLSKQDKEVLDESNSISNQRRLAMEYIRNDKELKKYPSKEYVDDGYSGKNFSRPAVQKLFQDIKRGIIQILIIKDFSRLGRDYIEVGNYTEKIFPALGVMVIAINDGFDSNHYMNQTPGIDTNFKNLVNDYYSEENSLKIKGDLWAMRSRGQYMATYAPMGYEKDPLDSKSLLLDREGADIIYHAFLFTKISGNYNKAGRMMEEKGFPTPQTYLQQKGVLTKGNYHDSMKKWSGGIVRRIVNNREYLGSVVFHTRESIQVGGYKVKHIPVQKREEIQDIHEPVIPVQLFLDAHKSVEIEKQKKRSGVEKRIKGTEDSPVKGILKCGNCRHNLTRRNRKNVTYYCRYRYSQGNVECCPGNISEEEILQVVHAAIKSQMMLIGDISQIKKQIEKKAEQEKKKHTNRLKEIRHQIVQAKQEKLKLYEEFSNGKLAANEYFEKKKSISERIYKLEEKEQNCAYMPIGKEEKANGIPNLYETFVGKEELSKELVHALISCIYVYDRNRVEIVFKHRDEIEAMIEEK